jgi:hypothetical protein
VFHLQVYCQDSSSFTPHCYIHLEAILSIMSALERYRYSLLRAKTSYRLLRLQLNENSEPLIGDLLEHTVDHSPPYQCISYAWGISEANDSIEIQGQKLAITKAVQMVLRWIRADQRNTTPELLWIDSICINQDDIEERGEQVRHMKKIYSGAERVLVYLGEEAEGSDQIPQLYLKIHEVYVKWSGSGAPGASKIPIEYPAADEYESMGLPTANDPVWDANRAFLGRPWFLRTWILQEVVLARTLFFICGSWGFDGEGLIRGWHCLIGAEIPYLSAGSWFAMAKGPPEGRAIHQILLMLDLGMGEDEKKSPSLVQLLHSSRQSLASNPRDYVYGLLGLTSDLYRNQISVDYEESVADTYRRVAKTIVKLGDGIELLYNIYGFDSELDLPSWVPDWSNQHAPFILLRPTPSNTSTTTDVPYVCAGGNVSDLHVGHEADVLICKGYIVDVIEKITNYHINEDSDEDLSRDGGMSADDEPGERKSKHAFTLLSRYLSEMAGLLETKSAYQPEKHEEIIWRTAIWNRGRTRQSKAPESYSKLYEAFKAFVRHRTLSKSGLLEEHRPKIHSLDRELGFIVPARIAAEIVIQEFREELEKAEKFGQWATTLCIQMRRCSTKRGYLGQVPNVARVGDIICVIAGAAVPFTVRRNDKGYNLIGQCYLHGYMEGEALSDPEVIEENIVLT